MDKSEFKAKIDEFLYCLEWMDNATYEIVHDDNYGEDEGEHWRATIQAKSGYGSRDVEVIPNPNTEHELAIDLGEDNYFDLTAEWFWAYMWHETEREVAQLQADLPRVKSIEDEIARLRQVIVDMRGEAKTLGFDNHAKRKRVGELEADKQSVQSELRSANYRLGQWNTMRNNYREEIRSLLRQRDRWKRRAQRHLVHTAIGARISSRP